MQNPNKPIWFNEDTYQTIQQSNTRTEVIDLSEPADRSPWKIMVCTPVHSECSIHYTQALLKFQQDCLMRKILVSFTLMKSSLVNMKQEQSFQCIYHTILIIEQWHKSLALV